MNNSSADSNVPFSTLAINLTSNATNTPEQAASRTPHEPQYSYDAAISYIAYKNQDPNTDSDLHVARRNFENKYQNFLTFFGQYANTALGKPTQTGFEGTLVYPINNDTIIFDKDKFPWQKPPITIFQRPPT